MVKWYSMADDIPSDGICVQKGVITVFSSNKAAELFSVDQLPFTSDHQRRNLLPAIYLAFCNKVRVDSLRNHIVNMEKPAHRLEFVREVRGVRYVNDSASTIPEATLAALDAFRTDHVVLIAGGSDKRLRFSSLARQIPSTHVRAVVFLPGNATPHLLREIRGAFDVPPPLVEVNTMPEAVEQATRHAKPGDVVLLSPGATSFGLFRHEFDRGNQFRKAVELL
jgi:UDP-N-acetylmuramoylalanine--D-glutamate ligase